MFFKKDNQQSTIWDKIFHQSPKSGLSLSPRKYFFRDILIVLGVVLVWRGTWHLIDMYFLPDHPVWSNTIGILIGLFLLYLPTGNLTHLSGRHHDEHKHH